MEDNECDKCGRRAIYDTLSDLAVLEEFRRALDYDDAAFQVRLRVKKSQLGVWRKRNRVPPEQRQKMLAILNATRSPEDQARDALRILDGVRNQLHRLLKGYSDDPMDRPPLARGPRQPVDGDQRDRTDGLDLHL